MVMGVVYGFIRSASRMEEQIFVPRCVLHASFAERLKPLTTCIGGRGMVMGVVFGFIRSAGRMEEQIFVSRCVLRASFAERLKPLTTCVGGGEW